MRPFRILAGCVVISVLAVSLVSLFAPAPCAAQAPAKADSWPESQEITPEALAKELKSGKKPIVVCVGFPVLYQAAHIPGARIEGPAREAAGLERLEKWARSVPRNTPVVIYCGCCPLSKCPNIRPAYQTLHRAGLTHIRVLRLENSFAADWVNKGYPTQRPK